MANYFTIIVNAEPALRKLDRKIKQIQKAGNQAPLETVNMAARFAQQIAPKDTGETANAIKATKGNNPYSATVVFSKGHRKGSDFNLTRFMNKYPTSTYSLRAYGDSYWKSGEAQFIKLTREFMKERYGLRFRQLIQGK